ncbi:dTMP kinase [Candidatus Uhrbacteria bacterium]|nr:dTMP kinase [Candidatus Uhrbacteria bacterium]
MAEKINKLDHGLFIVFEGGEGSGKTTQAKMLAERLTQKGYDILVTKQPGGDESICKAIRALVLDPQYFGTVSSRAEFLLFMADKAQHIDSVIQPALARGKIVLSDRYSASTFAYQVVARESCSREEFDFVARYALQGLQPHLTIWLDVDPVAGMQRNRAVPSQQLRFEKETIEFHRRVREGYEEYLTKHTDPSRVLRVDAGRSIDQNHATIIERMKELLQGR